MSDAAKGRAESGAEVGAMNEQTMNQREMNDRGVDETLRMVARMPAPEGLEERVKAGLRLAEMPGRVIAWPAGRSGASAWVRHGLMRSGCARGAAAAAIALVVAGGGWGIYARVGPEQSARSGALPQTKPSGTFNEAGAMRRPLTLVGPTVKPTPQKDGKTAKHSQVPETSPGEPGAGERKSGAAAVHSQGNDFRVTTPTQ